jgi:hypothetical protein
MAASTGVDVLNGDARARAARTMMHASSTVGPTVLIQTVGRAGRDDRRPGQTNRHRRGGQHTPLIGLARTPCKECKRDKVHVDRVSSGLLNTHLMQRIGAIQATIGVAGRDDKVGIQPALLQTMDGMTPLARSSTLAEPAGAVNLFCDHEPAYISGQAMMCGSGC